MSKRQEKLDPDQRQLEFSWERAVDEYVETRMEIERAVEEDPRPPVRATVSEFELCVEIAASVARAIRASNLSREQVVDGVNAYFGRSAKGAGADHPTCRNPLTIHMFQKYLAKPDEAPIPAYYLAAIQHVCDSLEPARALVEPMGGKVVTAEESRLLTLGKLENSIAEMQKLRRELRGK